MRDGALQRGRAEGRRDGGRRGREEGHAFPDGAAPVQIVGLLEGEDARVGDARAHQVIPDEGDEMVEGDGEGGRDDLAVVSGLGIGKAAGLFIVVGVC